MAKKIQKEDYMISFYMTLCAPCIFDLCAKEYPTFKEDVYVRYEDYKGLHLSDGFKLYDVTIRYDMPIPAKEETNGDFHTFVNVLIQGSLLDFAELRRKQEEKYNCERRWVGKPRMYEPYYPWE